MPGLGYWPMKTRFGERVCARCSKRYEALAPNQRYCSPECETITRNQRHGEQAKARRKAKREMANV